MSDFLEQVASERRAYVAAKRAARPLPEVVRAAERASRRLGAVSFSGALRARRLEGRLALIAEVKRRSPALGPLAEVPDPAGLARHYRRSGAAAISVLVEPHHWGGSLDDLRSVEPSLPLLAKDVIVDEYQIAEAREAGAHAVLLIAELFTLPQLERLISFGAAIGVEALVEAHETDSFVRALASSAPAVGVNARDLRHPERIDRERVHQLVREVATDQVFVAESGIASVRDAQALPPRVDAILVGTALVTSQGSDLAAALANVRPAKVLA